MKKPAQGFHTRIFRYEQGRLVKGQEGAGGGPLPIPEDFLAGMTSAMRRRMGETSAARLRWVLDFAYRDLDILRREERVALAYDLLTLAAHTLPLGAGGHGGPSTAATTMSDESLRGYQREIAEGLRGMLDLRNLKAWPIPAQPALALRPMGSSNPEDSRGPRFRVIFEGDERAGIIGGVAHLVIEAGDLLRSCRECGRPFVRVRRQEYCSATCSQKTRNRRMAEKAQPTTKPAKRATKGRAR